MKKLICWLLMIAAMACYTGLVISLVLGEAAMAACCIFVGIFCWYAGEKITEKMPRYEDDISQ